MTSGNELSGNRLPSPVTELYLDGNNSDGQVSHDTANLMAMLAQDIEGVSVTALYETQSSHVGLIADALNGLDPTSDHRYVGEEILRDAIDRRDHRPARAATIFKPYLLITADYDAEGNSAPKDLLLDRFGEAKAARDKARDEMVAFSHRRAALGDTQKKSKFVQRWATRANRLAENLGRLSHTQPY